jgi:hypothetical protein
MVAPPETRTKPELKEKRPRGWQFREHYVAPSGIKYSYGKEVTDDVAISTTLSTHRVQSKAKTARKKVGKTARKKRSHYKSA